MKATGSEGEYAGYIQFEDPSDESSDVSDDIMESSSLGTSRGTSDCSAGDTEDGDIAIDDNSDANGTQSTSDITATAPHTAAHGNSVGSVATTDDAHDANATGGDTSTTAAEAIRVK